MDLRNAGIEEDSIKAILKVFDLQTVRNLDLKGNPSLNLDQLVQALLRKNSNSISYVNLSEIPFSASNFAHFFNSLPDTGVTQLNISRAGHRDDVAEVIADYIGKLERIDVWMDGNEITPHVN